MQQELTEQHMQDAFALKRAFPYRIIWAAVDTEGNKIQGADHNKRQINKMLRLGYKVWVLQ